ncbi:BLUF domain-containing protein [uncultured Tateyamaria sp.]|uniref:BLUF domain-containing protein n=1 Tax=uncultured Tateyamaria sp. TaxID=455651 RepID=UPI002605D716|nr:BLUF domain-containing protein [uncultured Tateyamaria sp.]
MSQILNISRRNNARDGITGLLAYHDGRFLQVLEGPEGAVAACLARINVDQRHTRVRTLSAGPVKAALFPKWRMGYATPQDLQPAARDSLAELSALADICRIGGTPDPKVEQLVRSFLVSSGAGWTLPAG